MSTIYITIDGDVLDAICYRHYGYTNQRIVEQVLVVNHGLADIGEVYQAGLTIKLPNIEVKEQARLKLWD